MLLWERSWFGVFDLWDKKSNVKITEGQSPKHRSAVCFSVPLTWQHCQVGTPEAVAHGISSQANIHARIFLLGSGYQELVEIRSVGTRPNLPRGQDHEAVVSNLHEDPE